MTSAKLAEYDSGPALVAYLAQPDASPIVCDLRARGPHISRPTPDILDALVDGLGSGKTDPTLWRRCIDVLLKGLPRDQAQPLFDELARVYRKALRGSDIEQSPAVAERLAMIHRLFLERPAGLDGSASVVQPLLEELRAALAEKKLGPVAARFGQELVATLDVEHGQWQGRTVDVAMMDTLATSGNEMTLTRFADRLPSLELREQARLRILRIHIALSPFQEVRDGASAVEQAVMRDGHNRVALGEHPLMEASFDARTTPIRGVLVRQHIGEQTATLLGYAEGRPSISVLPEISLREALWARFQSISRPVSLCRHRRELDPSPCIAVADVSLDNPLAYLDKGGAFHFRDNVALSEVIPLAQNDNFLLPVLVGGQPARLLQWGMHFERPEDLAFGGASPGDNGPPLGVRVEKPNPARFLFGVNSPNGRYWAVVEGSDVLDFHVYSSGAQGYTGSTGSTGSSGSAGSECSDGGPGGSGGPGGDGGPGGNGGEVRVEVACGGAPCPDTVALLRQVILSLGGPGGAGGSGGAGGAGGAGGSGRSPSTHTDQDGNTVTDDPGCSAGASGSSGASGPDGSPGPSGLPGTVAFSVVK